ncbi:MAG: helix-turn-helix transcriptional regulator [Lachnospiraceae bacterium]|nr:helix-turn-helix transcriptional regulator [Lachnospiraceae bacterium]
MAKKKTEEITCPLEYGLQLFGGKWESKIICVLSDNRQLRYGAIRDKVEGITDAALGNTLKKLVSEGLIDRIQYNEIPPRVEYSLTEKGKSVVPVIHTICEWSETNTDSFGPCFECEMEKI